LLACGDTYNNGIFGGEAKHKLTVNEMPSHSHDMDEESYGGGGYKNKMGIRQDGGGSSHWTPKYAQTTSYSTYKPTYTGGGQAHNNMPPYFTVYIWKRTG
jgi:microcystin-dependent protein